MPLLDEKFLVPAPIEKVGEVYAQRRTSLRLKEARQSFASSE